MKVFVTWSGGKESTLALYEARRSGLEVSWLVNMTTKNAKRSMSHGLPSKLISLQAQAIGTPMVQKKTTWGRYERDFKNIIHTLKEKGITGGVFGDINLLGHRDWDERVCSEVGIKLHLPLWGREELGVLKDFTERDFEAIVVATKAELFGEEWLGRKIDRDFIRDISRFKDSISLCGEEGEYHTFVTNGPLFKKRIKITKMRKVLKNGRWFLDILGWKIV